VAGSAITSPAHEERNAADNGGHGTEEMDKRFAVVISDHAQKADWHRAVF
jgi:hypothetical protein